LITVNVKPDDHAGIIDIRGKCPLPLERPSAGCVENGDFSARVAHKSVRHGYGIDTVAGNFAALVSCCGKRTARHWQGNSPSADRHEN
jgi:hypothetical protein